MQRIQGKLQAVRVRKTRDPASLRPPRHESYFYHYELLIDDQAINMVFHNRPQDFKSGQELILAVFDTVLGKEAFAYKDLSTDQVRHTGFILAELFWGVVCSGAALWFLVTSFRQDNVLLWRFFMLGLAGFLLLGARHYLRSGLRTYLALLAVKA